MRSEHLATILSGAHGSGFLILTSTTANSDETPWENLRRLKPGEEIRVFQKDQAGANRISSLRMVGEPFQSPTFNDTQWYVSERL